MNKSLIGLLAGLAAIAALVAGCGSSSSEESSSTESTATISKAEFLKQGNKICAEGNREIEEGFNAFSKEENLSEKTRPTNAQLEKAANTVIIPSVRGQIEALRALGKPEGDQGEVDGILANAEAALEEVEAEPTLIAMEGSKEPFATVNKEASAYGLTACAEEGGEGGEEG